MTTSPAPNAPYPPTHKPPAIEAVGLTKTYGSGETLVHALNGVNLTIPAGKFVAIMGPSGSGKSTLLHCLAGLDRADQGGVRVGGMELTTLNDNQLTKLRREHIGFVFQAFNLVPTLTAAENIQLPFALAGKKVDQGWYQNVVHNLGLAERLSHKPSQLSGGQQQRVAIARALLTRPAVLFGDEPTGNLDTVTSAEVLRLLRTSVDQLNQTVVMVTHDPVAAGYADQVVLLADGQIAGILQHPTIEQITQRLTALREGAVNHA
ncbi:ABC transporter ATP-binding protein [Micrococcoides hystricis]|uniref:ABC transporter ATP-binding protein n=1 Tax=Micrococcoides hystricis TaxID=1572761 RepID=A0ABV6PCS9_9MICC